MASIRKKKFKAEVLGGHKDNAVEVPFDPVKEWKIEARPLWRGRRGHPVVAKISGVEFESAIVPRQKKLYLLIDSDSVRAARVSVGAMVEVEVIPLGE